jgi:hypothetical protein
MVTSRGADFCSAEPAFRRTGIDSAGNGRSGRDVGNTCARVGCVGDEGPEAKGDGGPKGEDTYGVWGGE